AGRQRPRARPRRGYLRQGRAVGARGRRAADAAHRRPHRRRHRGLTDPRSAAQIALSAALSAGASAADAVAVEADSLEARVRGEEIDFVKQARERKLGVRALVRGARGIRSAITSTSDLTEPALRAIAAEAVALARATAEDPAAGLPEDGFAELAGAPDLALADPAHRHVRAGSLIDAARRAEGAARAVDPRIENSEGSSASAGLPRGAHAGSAGVARGAP